MALTIATGGAGEDNSATYRIDYAGMKVWYCAMTQSGKQIAPPEQARAGEEVVIYYPMIATDTDYTFLVDGCYFAISVRITGETKDLSCASSCRTTTSPSSARSVTPCTRRRCRRSVKRLSPAGLVSRRVTKSPKQGSRKFLICGKSGGTCCRTR